MEYEKEFKGLYQFSKRVSPIWKNHGDNFKGTYKIICSFVKKVPIFRDDYIEPFDYKYVDYVTIQDVETKEKFELELAYFNNMFTFKVKETLVFNDYLSVQEFVNNNDVVYDCFRKNGVYELDIYE